jgi:hypothetical protein
MPNPPLSLPIQNVFRSFGELGAQVHLALRTQVGDLAQLAEHRRLCLQFLNEASQVE